MKLIKPSFEIIPQAPGLEGIYKQIELAGRTCYKSEDKITETSAKEFVDRMIKSGHGAMLEHGTIYLDCPPHVFTKYIYNPYSKCKYIKSHIEMDEEYCSSLYYTDKQENFFVTTNMRVLVENGWLDDLQYLCEPTEYHEKRITVKFICDRGVSHEFVRHRVFSFAQESTRYCNYSRDKFGNEITYIQPCWEMQKDEEELFLLQLEQAQNSYNALISSGWKPQQARAILPNSLKTELVMTGFISDWEHFFELRTPNNAHPQARELAIPLMEEFRKMNYL
jgi:thymidylate synthase (FAD)